MNQPSPIDEQPAQIELTFMNPPDWLSRFVHKIAESLRPYDFLAPLGCNVILVDETWEVALFVGATEVVGGRSDGKLIESRFAVDVLALQKEFSLLEEFIWQAHPYAEDDEMGPYLQMTGKVNGYKVSLCLCANPPERFEPSRMADVNRGQFIDLW